MPTDSNDMLAAFSAARQRFPACGHDIRFMMDRNEAFFEMCEELAMADMALANIASVPAAERDTRADECRVWIERLTAEIAEALERSNVIPMGSRSRSR